MIRVVEGQILLRERAFSRPCVSNVVGGVHFGTLGRIMLYWHPWRVKSRCSPARAGEHVFDVDLLRRSMYWASWIDGGYICFPWDFVFRTGLLFQSAGGRLLVPTSPPSPPPWSPGTVRKVRCTYRRERCRDVWKVLSRSEFILKSW